MTRTHRISSWRRAALAGATALSTLFVAGAASAQSGPADTLRIAVKSLPPGFGRADQGTASPTVYATWPIYDSLTKVNMKSEVEPWLALSWKNVDKTNWEVKLRPNVKFQNGEAMTAQAVADWFNYLMTDAGVGTVAGTNLRQLLRMDHVDVVDDSTIRVVSKTPQPIMPNMLSQAFVPSVKNLKEVGVETFARAPVGTGPYRATAYKGGEIEYVAFESSWRAPKIKNLRVVALEEAATRVQAILSNQVDLAQNVSMDAVQMLESAGNVADFALRPSVMGWRLFSVSRDTPFKDKRVRQAANFALDRESMNKNLLLGRSAGASQCATTFTNGYNPSAPAYTHDPKKAKDLLTAAGYGNGFDTVIEVLPESFPADGAIYQKAAQDMTAVGIRVELRQITFADWLKKWFVPAGSTTLGFVGGGFQNECHNDQMDAIGAFRNISCRLTPAHHCDEEENKLLDAADTEFDPAKRTKILQDLLAKNSENAPMVFMVELRDVTGVNKRVQNFKNEIQRWNVDQITFKN
ncbi:MAG: ABC transporter substrate-binding protein [Alphaproteobacteria bacterium]|nr:ABC transporter substrate-binding protein [Alphaproteobacteria bacterium]